MSDRKVILNSDQLKLTINRLSSEIIENHIELIDKCVIIGMQPRGVLLSKQIHTMLEFDAGCSVKYGLLDSTFFIYSSGTWFNTNQVGFEVRQANHNSANATCAVLTYQLLRQISNNGTGNGIANRDVPVVARTYKDNTITTLHRIGSSISETNFTEMAVKLKYRIYDSGTFT